MFPKLNMSNEVSLSITDFVGITIPLWFIFVAVMLSIIA